MKGKPELPEEKHLEQEIKDMGHDAEMHQLLAKQYLKSSEELAHELIDIFGINPMQLRYVEKQVNLMGKDIATKVLRGPKDEVFISPYFSGAYLISQEVKEYMLKHKGKSLTSDITSSSIRAIEDDQNIIFQTYLEGRVIIPIVTQDFYRNMEIRKSEESQKEDVLWEIPSLPVKVSGEYSSTLSESFEEEEMPPSLDDKAISTAIKIGSTLFGAYNFSMEAEVRQELRRTSLTEEALSGFLLYFIEDKKPVPEGFFVLDDPIMQQTYFVEGDIADYLLKNFGGEEDIIKLDPLMLRDNPNIHVEEIYRGRIAIAKLEKVFSGKNLQSVGANEVFSDYRNRPKSSHDGEHALEKLTK